MNDPLTPAPADANILDNSNTAPSRNTDTGSEASQIPDSGSAPESDSGEPKPQPSKRKTFLSRLGKVISGFIVVSMTATEAMMFFMFGRTTPVTQTPFLTQAWAQEHRMYWKNFDFLSGENQLKGFIASGAHPKAMVVIVHGIKASTDELDPMIRYFLSEDYAVMSFDGTACGRSEGTNTVGLQQQRFDLKAALECLKKEDRFKDLPLILVGHSAGAYAVAAEAENAKAAAIVCISGFEAPLGTMKFWAEHYAGALTNIEYPFLWYREVSQKGQDADTHASSVVASSKVPALIVHGSNDEVIPLEISLYNSLSAQNNRNVHCLLVQDERYNGHSNIIVSGDQLNDPLMHMVTGFLYPYVYALR